MNVVLVTVDCFRHDKCGFSGYSRPVTPNLTSIAQESYVFNHAYATGPYTTESLPGIVAGQHSYNGVYFGQDPAWKAIPPNSTTLASHLNEHGYTTTAVLTNPHITAARNFDKGFESFTNLRTKGTDRAESDHEDGDSQQRTMVSRLQDKFDMSSSKYSPYVIPYIAYRYSQYRSDWPTTDGKVLVEKFCSELQSIVDPFFAWTHFMDLHAPIHPRVTSTRVDNFGGELGTFQHLYHIGSHSRSRSDLTYDQIYDAAVNYVDKQIGKIIEKLQSIGRWEETILIVTGDHGEVLGDRMGIYGHPRHHHYDESLRVPLLVRVPGFQGKSVKKPVSLAWIPKIITELINMSTGDFPYEMGIPAVFETSNDPSPQIISDSLDAHGHTISVRNGNNKLICHRPDDNTLDTSYPYFEGNINFRYQIDPAERYPNRTKIPQKLYNIAENIATEAGDVPNIRGEIPSSIKNRLEDLGYLME